MGHPETHPDADNVDVYSETPPPPRIPWERRKQIGSFRAYWRTAKIVITRPQELEKFLAEPVNEKHAKYFRSLTFQFTAALWFFIIVAFKIYSYEATRSLNTAEQAAAHNLLVNVLSILGAGLSLVGLFLATRSLEWFSRPADFDPAGRERATSLSCYMCAPILIISIIGAVAFAASMATFTPPDPTALWRTMIVSWPAIFLAWYPVSVRALHFTTGQKVKRTVSAAIALPLVWAAQQFLMTYLPISSVMWFNMAWSFL